MNESFKYRDHRGGLAESLETTQVFNSLNELIDYLKQSLKEYNFEFLNSDIKIKPYCYDKRIHWNTYIVTIKNFGVVGFTDSNPF